MAGPWEKYAPQDGPWTKYGGNSESSIDPVGPTKAAAASENMAGRIAAAKAGTLQASPERLAAAQAADDVATAKMGMPSTPTGEATAIVERSPYMGFEAYRSQKTPILGAWADEIAGAGEALTGGDYEHGRQRALEVARIYGEQNPRGAKAAGALGIVEGIGGAMAIPVVNAPAAFTKLPHVAQSMVAGGIGGGIEAASTAAGQAEPGERISDAGKAVLPGVIFGAATAGALDLAVTGLSAASRRILRRSVEKPTVESLRAGKTAAYRDVDKAGERFSQGEIVGLVDNVKAALDDVDFVESAGGKMSTWLRRLEKTAERPEGVSLSRLDTIRSNMFKAYRAAPDEVELLDAIRAIDDLIGARASSSALLRTARDANSRYMKAQLIDDAFDKALRQTEASGSGGNIFNKYLQAVNSIIDNPNKARWFSAEEMTAMREFVKPSNSQEILRRVGKLSPSGNGLMQALNIAAVVANPGMAIVSAGAAGAKAVADRSARAGRNQLFDMIATGNAQREVARRLPTSTGFGAGVGINALSGLPPETP